MAAGARDTLVVVETEVSTREPGGGYAVSWQEVGTIWAHVRPASGREMVESGAQVGQTLYLVTVVNQGAGAAITEKHRLVLSDGSILNVRWAPAAFRAPERLIHAQSGTAT